MKNLITLATLLFSFIGLAQEPSTTEITITVSNIPGNEGKVIVSLFDEDTFMKAPPIMSGSSKIVNGQAIIVFEEVPEGDYGAISFHDKNNNDRIDMEANGMPTEAYGVSNNPMSFGPPQWTDAKFTVGTSPLSLGIRY